MLTADVSSTNQSLRLRKSCGQSLHYKSEKKSVVCNKDQYTNCWLDHLQNISLQRTVDETYKAEDTLKDYTEIHVKS